MFSIILTEFRGFVRNRVNLFFCILFPSLLTFLLGTFLDGMYTGDDTIESIHMIYVAEKQDSSSNALEEFLNQMEAEEMLTYEKGSDLETAKEMLATQEADGILVNTAGKLVLYGGIDTVKVRTLRTLLKGYLQMESTYLTAFQYMEYAKLPASDETKNVGNGGTEHIKLSGLGTSQSMMDYYAVAMLVMIMFMGCIMGGSEIVEENKRLHTQDRIALSPLSPVKVYLAQMIGSIPLCVIQVAAMMLSSVFLFGAKYCDKWQNNVLLIAMLLMVSFAVLSFGVLCSMILPISSAVIFIPVCWFMLAFSGSFSKDIHIPGFSEYLPTYLIQKAAFDLTVFAQREKAIRVLGVSFIIFVICFTAGLIKIHRRKSR